MTDVADLRDSRMAGVPMQAFESPVAFTHSCQLNDGFGVESIPRMRTAHSHFHCDEIVGKSDALRRVLEEIETVAPARLDGIDLRRDWHRKGTDRAARCTTLACKIRRLHQIQLFRHPNGLAGERAFRPREGAFTGAISQRLGRFELANGGSIFLDEIGEIPLEVQPTLLRVLQEREFERLGGTRTIRTNSRLIGQLNRDLKLMVQEKKFRSDLYYRLKCFPNQSSRFARAVRGHPAAGPALRPGI